MITKLLTKQYTYTVYKIELSGKLSNCNRLNNLDELNEFLDTLPFNNLLVVQDKTNKKRKGMITGDGEMDFYKFYKVA